MRMNRIHQRSTLRATLSGVAFGLELSPTQSRAKAREHCSTVLPHEDDAEPLPHFCVHVMHPRATG